jgi:hypothetical protein
VFLNLGLARKKIPVFPLIIALNKNTFAGRHILSVFLRFYGFCLLLLGSHIYMYIVYITTFKLEGEVTSLSGSSQVEVEDNREKWGDFREKLMVISIIKILFCNPSEITLPNFSK